jgi:hypothetical protein
MELNSEIKPMSHTRSRRITFCGGGDRGWGARIAARLDGSHEANKIVMNQVGYDVPLCVNSSVKLLSLRLILC